MQIFISYRRDDSADISGRIDDRLAAHFGRENVFKDVDTIPFGVDFVEYLDAAVKKCDILLAVIGRQWWLSIENAKGRRLEDPHDFVRIEVESALARGIPVVPLFVQGVTGLDTAQLPDSLKSLSRRNAIEIRRDPDFHKDMDRLIRDMDSNHQPAKSTPPPKPEPAFPTKITTPFEMEFVTISAGEFLMGSNKTKDTDALKREFPQHSLYLPAFALGKTPVTNQQYAIFIAQTGYAAPKHFQNAKPPKGDNDHPVVQVNWPAAMAFCDWMTAKTGLAIGLPSEAQWEKAARGTDGRIYPWGNRFDKNRLNFYESGLKGTTPVGQYSPLGDSPYGCVDMVGNVLEWMRSLWGENRRSPEFIYPYDSADGRENLDASEEVLRVLRGGFFVSAPQDVRCAYRFHYSPNFCSFYVGFRIALSPFNSQNL